jgi:hypothetical protein
MVDIPSARNGGGHFGKLPSGGLASHGPHAAYVRDLHNKRRVCPPSLLSFPQTPASAGPYEILHCLALGFNFLSNLSSHISYAYPLQTTSESNPALRNGYKGLQ